jgi:hypothetical protein
MKRRKENSNSSTRMGKGERQQNSKYIEDVGKVIASLSCKDKMKYKFSKRFVNNLQLSSSDFGNRIQIGPLDSKILEYFIFSILVEYEHSALES